MCHLLVDDVAFCVVFGKSGCCLLDFLNEGLAFNNFGLYGGRLLLVVGRCMLALLELGALDMPEFRLVTPRLELGLLAMGCWLKWVWVMLDLGALDMPVLRRLDG